LFPKNQFIRKYKQFPQICSCGIKFEEIIISDNTHLIPPRVWTSDGAFVVDRHSVWSHASHVQFAMRKPERLRRILNPSGALMDAVAPRYDGSNTEMNATASLR
jgi:hypothetical protein